MARVTKADLEAKVSMLRWSVEKLQLELSTARQEATLYKTQYSILTKYISTITIAVERVSDALAHSIGHVTAPDRARHIQSLADGIYQEKYGTQEPDLRTFETMLEDERKGKEGR